MAKKRKAQPQRQSLPKLRERARNALHRGDHREALELYKQLFKQQPDADTRADLAVAYLNRAAELAVKGHYRDAAALWENMAGSCGEREQGVYIEWLLLGGRVERGARLLQEADATLTDSNEAARLHALLALVLLGQPAAAGEALPADSPLWEQREAMLSALQAYCAGDDDALRESLKAIPFRSAYRDLRSLLQALARRDSEPGEAREQLRRIPAHSPLAPLARSLATHDGADDTALIGLPAPLRDLLLALRGWTPARREALSRFPTGDPENAKAVLRFALGVEDVDPALLRRFCLAWLPRHPEGMASVERKIGPLSNAEREWVKAQAGEWQRDPDTLKRHWPRCAEALVKEDRPLAAALVFRHLADILDNARASHPWDSAPQQYLQRALELDPADRAGYLKLIGLARREGDSKLQQTWAERAAKQFPEDVEIRLLAADVAYRRGAFKQAAGHAASALARDSLNPAARSELLLSHVAMARQHVKQGRHDLAQRDLQALDGTLSGSEPRAILALVRSLVHLDDKQRDAAQQHLRTAIDALGEGLATRFRFLVHGKRMYISQRTLTRLYNEVSPPKQEPAPTPATLMELASLIRRFRIDGDEEILDTLDQLQKPLKDAARLDLEEDQYRTLLDALFEVEHHALLAHYGRIASRHFLGHPRFLFFEIFGRHKGDETGLNHTDHFRLKHVMDVAESQEDQQLMEWIDDFLYDGLPPFLGDVGLPTQLPSMPPMPPEVRAVLEEVMDRLGTDDPMEALQFIMEMSDEEDDDAMFPPLPFPPRGRRR